MRCKICKTKLLFYLHFRARTLNAVLLCWYYSTRKKFSHTSDKRDHLGILYLYNWGTLIHRSKNISHSGANYCTVSITFRALSLIQTEITDGVSGKQAFILLFSLFICSYERKACWKFIETQFYFVFYSAFYIFYSNSNEIKLILT